MKKIHFQKRELKIVNQKKKTMKKIIISMIMIMKMKIRKNLQKKKERKIM